MDDTKNLAGGDGVSVHSGFSNPALGEHGQEYRPMLDLNHLLIRRPGSTYLLRIRGHRWADQGVHDGDIVVIDRSLTPRTTDLVLSGSDLLRYAHHRSNGRSLGVVTAVIHPVGSRTLLGDQTI